MAEIERWTIWVGGVGRIEVIPASILNDCIEELERREADSLKVAAETEVSPSFATAYRHRAAAFNKAADLLREKSGQSEGAEE